MHSSLAWSLFWSAFKAKITKISPNKTFSGAWINFSFLSSNYIIISLFKFRNKFNCNFNYLCNLCILPNRRFVFIFKKKIYKILEIFYQGMGEF